MKKSCQNFQSPSHDFSRNPISLHPQKSDLQHGLVFNNPICELWNKIKIIKTCFILNECILNISVIHILSGRRRGCVVLTNEAEKKSFIYRKRVCKTSENETKINIFWFSHVKNLVGSSMCSAHAEAGNQRSCGTAHKKKKNYPSAYTALYQVCNTGKKTSIFVPKHLHPEVCKNVKKSHIFM